MRRMDKNWYLSSNSLHVHDIFFGPAGRNWNMKERN
jgi:hypothetical protein